MSLIESLQNISSPIITTIFEIFKFLSSMPMLILIFAILFIFFSTSDAFKMGLSYIATYLFCGLFLNNIIQSPQPYKTNENLFALRDGATFNGFPSVKMANVAGVACLFCLQQKSNKKTFITLIFFSILLCIGVTFSQLYYAQNYLIDLIIGAIIGAVIYFVIYRFVKIKNYTWSLFLLIIPIIVLFCFVKEWGISQGHLQVFEFCGFSCGLILFCFLQDKYIKYQPKNNLIFCCLKIFLLLIIFTIYYVFCRFCLSSCMILVFLGYFIAMGIVCFLLPILFKYLEKYFYVFDKNVNLDKVVFSKIVLSTNGTKKVAKQLKNLLQKGDIVILQGNLGAGKTQLTRNLLQLFGVNNTITSPTFTILNEYDGKDEKFYHFDMYRIEDEDEVENLGFDEILDDNQSYKFIEWAEKIPNHLPKHYKKITIVKLGKNSRNIVLEQI